MDSLVGSELPAKFLEVDEVRRTGAASNHCSAIENASLLALF